MRPRTGHPTAGGDDPVATLTGRALLLDLDGTLLDSTAAITASWVAVAASIGVEWEVVAPLVHGIPPRQVVRQVAPWLDDDAWARAVDQFHQGVILDGAPVLRLPGAQELVEALAGQRWAVVTSGSRELADSSLRKSGLPRPPLMVTAEDVAVGKPDPAPYVLAAELLDVPVGECVVVEDAPAGVQAGRAAQMRVVAVTGTCAPELLAEATVVAARLPRVRVLGTGLLELTVERA